MIDTDRAESLRRAYASVVLPEDVVADLDASAFVQETTVKYDGAGTIDVQATLRNEGARMFWLRFREKVTAAKRPRAEPPATHAVSSTAKRAT